MASDHLIQAKLQRRDIEPALKVKDSGHIICR